MKKLLCIAMLLLINTTAFAAGENDTVSGTKDLLGQSANPVTVNFSTVQKTVMFDEKPTTPLTYAEFECDMYYEKDQASVDQITFEGSGLSGNVFGITNKALNIGRSETVMTIQDGWYRIKAVLDFKRSNMIVTVTMPDGSVVQRADARYLWGATSLTRLYATAGDGGLKNTSLKTSYTDDAEDKALLEIVGIIKSGTEVSGLSQLKVGDTVTLETEYTSISGAAQDFTIQCAYYDADGRLAGVQTAAEGSIKSGYKSKKANFNFILGDISDIKEIKFFAWDSVNGMRTLNKSISLEDITFSTEQVYNIVTTFIGDAKTSRGFAWTAAPEYTDMVISYIPSGGDWRDAVVVDAEYTEFRSELCYKADVTGLEAGETYIYKIGDTVDDMWSREYRFTTEQNDVESFSFIGVTDPQSSEWKGGFDYFESLMDRAMLENPDVAFTINVGDAINSGTEQAANGKEEEEWKGYFKALRGYSEGLPHMVVSGNHETRGGTELSGKQYSLRFNNPDNGEGALGDLTEDKLVDACNKGVLKNIEESIYSFDYGNAHFAVLNSGSDWNQADSLTLLNEQAKWLKEDMNASDKKWKIVLVHISAYPARTQRFGTAEALRTVMDECGVDLVLQGHDHIVTRTYPMKNNKIVTKKNFNTIEKGTGTVYTILGSAGPKRYDLSESTPEYAAVHNTTAITEPCYSLYEVSEDSIKVITKQMNGMVVDEYTITARAN